MNINASSELAQHRRVRIERMALLADGCKIAGVGGVLAALITAASLWRMLEEPRITLMWLALVLPLSLANLWFYRRMAAPELELAAAERLENLYALRCGLVGMCWGGLIFLFPGPQNVSQMAMIGVVVLTVAIANVGALAVSRPAFLSFVMPTLAPMAGLLIVHPPATMPLAGWGVLVFLLFVLFLQHTLNNTLISTLRRRIHSEALVQEQQVIFDTAAEAIVLVRGTHVVKCNQRFCELIGTPAAEVIGSPMWVWHEDALTWTQHEQAAQLRGRSRRAYTYITPLRRRDGSVFSAELTGMPVDPANPEAGMVWMGSDISERLATEAALRHSEERFRRLVSMSSDLYWEQDDALRFTRISGASLAILAPSLGQAEGRCLWELPGIAGVNGEQWRALRQQLAAHSAFRDLVMHFPDANGEQRWLAWSGNPLHDEHERFLGYHGIATDITERIRNAERYRHLAYHDSLTGLPNRRLLSDRLEQGVLQARRRHTQLALMLLDLDGFKQINDTEGHAVGDAVLATLAHRLRVSVRESDTVARIGGDEFVVLLPQIESRLAALDIAEKILSAVREPVRTEARDYVLGVSIGIALYPADGDSGEVLLQRADATMYSAKQAGGRHARFASTA